jgi:hypothetical protein
MSIDKLYANLHQQHIEFPFRTEGSIIIFKKGITTNGEGYSLLLMADVEVAVNSPSFIPTV